MMYPLDALLHAALSPDPAPLLLILLLLQLRCTACCRASSQIREFLRLKYPPETAAAASTTAASSSLGAAVDAQLAASISWPLADLPAVSQQLLACKDLSAADAELAVANLALLLPGSGAGGGAVVAHDHAPPLSSMRQHVWYGDPLLTSSGSDSSSGICHSVAGGYAAMETLLIEGQRQDWSAFEHAGQLVCRDVEGWRAVVDALHVKPTLLRDPCPDLALDRFTPCANVDEMEARVYAADLACE